MKWYKEDMNCSSRATKQKKFSFAMRKREIIRRRRRAEETWMQELFFVIVHLTQPLHYMCLPEGEDLKSKNIFVVWSRDIVDDCTNGIDSVWVSRERIRC